MTAHATGAATAAEAVQGAVQRGEIAGGVTLIARGDAVQVEVAGVQDLRTRVPMARDTIFRIMSMTKPIIAAAAMILVEERRIALDDPVQRWLPELADRRVLRAIDAAVDDTVPARRAITLDDLLTFRLGIGAIMAPPGSYPVQAAIADLGLAPGPRLLPFGPDEFMERIGQLPLLHQPGERWMYHTGADILTVLIARVTGVALGDFLRERIVAPLRMQDAGFSVPAADLGRFPTGYELAGDQSLREWDSAVDGEYVRPPPMATEMVATADDYLAFARMLLAGGQGPDGPVLAAESVRQMMTDHLTPAQKAASPFFPGFWEGRGWGYGGAVALEDRGTGQPGSYGWMGGFGTSVLIDPAARLTVLVLTQRLMRGPEDAALHGQVQKLACRNPVM